MTRSAGDKGGLAFMKSRIASVVTVAALLGGTGGAIAVASHGTNSPNNGAATGQYRPGKGCGDKNHIHTGAPGNPGNTSCPNR